MSHRSARGGGERPRDEAPTDDQNEGNQAEGIEPEDDAYDPTNLPGLQLQDPQPIEAQGLRVFVEYQLSFREDRLVVEAEWNRKSLEEKGAWHEQMGHIQVLERDASRYREDLEGPVRDALDLNAARLKDFREFSDLIDSILPMLDYWIQCVLYLALDYEDLAEIERGQAGSRNERSVHEATNRAQQYNEQYQRMDRERATLQVVRENTDREVPLDADGRRRIPWDWGMKMIYRDEKSRAMDAGQQARDAGNVGLLNRRGARHWVAWQQYQNAEAALSEGWLWVAFDEDNCVMDRVFVKDVFTTEEQWHDIRLHDGDVRDPNSKTPLELACHKAMLTVDRFDKVVRLRESNRNDLVDHKAMKFRLYVEWAQNGDLSRLIDRYEKAKLPIPEPMIWCVAESLAESAVAMKDGKMHGGSEPGWREIVHRDMKPENVFLAGSDISRYPYYPKPLLADFGLAFRTTADDPNNPSWYGSNGAGTYGYKAPEQCVYIDQQTEQVIEGPRLTEKANMYGIGAILSAMMRARSIRRQPIWLGEGASEDTLHTLQVPEDDEDPGYAQYSPELRVLTNICLDYNPAKRFSAKEFLRAVRDFTAERVEERPGQESDGPLRNRAQGMRSGKFAGGAAGVPPGHQVAISGDQYQLGMARGRLPGNGAGNMAARLALAP